MSAAVFGDVASQNIVGYAGSDLDLNYGAKSIGAQFIPVGATANKKFKLKDIVLVAAKGVKLSGKITVQLLSNAGKSSNENTWYWDGSDWCDNIEDEPVGDDVAFDIGQGIWVSNLTGADVNFQSSGEVEKEDIVFPLDLNYGAVAVANGYPVPVQLNEFLLDAAKGVKLGGKITVQLLSNAGKSSNENTWYWDGSDWCDNIEDEPVPDTLKIEAGRGMWVSNLTGAPVSLRIPAPEF